MPKAEKAGKLSHLAAAAADEDAGSGFMNPVKTKKNGEHRKNCRCEKCRGGEERVETGPSQDMPPPDPQAQIDALKPIVKPVLELVSQAGVVIAEDKEAAMPEDTFKILLDSSCACINQYLPSTMTAHASLIVFSLTFGNWAFGVYMLRRSNLEKLIKERQMRENAATGDPGLRTEKSVVAEVQVV